MSLSGDVAVIGGTGFIGRRLVERLRLENHGVRVISRSAGPALAGAGVSFVRGDVANAGEMRAALEGTRAVYHLAMGGGATWADYERDFVQGARNVAQACLEHGVGRLIYTSSVAALYLGCKGAVGDADGPDPRPESRGLYARAKVGAERALREIERGCGLPLVIVRPAIVVGSGGILSHSGAGNWASDICCIGWGRGRTPLPFVLVDDVAGALVAALDAPGIEGMALNLAGDVRLSAREFVSELARRSLRSFRFHPRSLVRLQAVEILKWLTKAAARKPGNAFPSWRDLKSRALRADLDCAAAKRLLGWKPVADAEEFLRLAVDVHLPRLHPGDLRLGDA